MIYISHYYNKYVCQYFIREKKMNKKFEFFIFKIKKMEEVPIEFRIKHYIHNKDKSININAKDHFIDDKLCECIYVLTTTSYDDINYDEDWNTPDEISYDTPFPYGLTYESSMTYSEDYYEEEEEEEEEHVNKHYKLFKPTIAMDRIVKYLPMYKDCINHINYYEIPETIGNRTIKNFESHTTNTETHNYKLIKINIVNTNKKYIETIYDTSIDYNSEIETTELELDQTNKHMIVKCQYDVGITSYNDYEIIHVNSLINGEFLEDKSGLYPLSDKYNITYLNKVINLYFPVYKNDTFEINQKIGKKVTHTKGKYYINSVVLNFRLIKTELVPETEINDKIIL